MLEDTVDTHSSTTEPCHQLLLSKLSKRPTLKERAAERRARGNGKLAQLDKNIMHLNTLHKNCKYILKVSSDSLCSIKEGSSLLIWSYQKTKPVSAYGILKSDSERYLTKFIIKYFSHIR